MGLHGLVGEVGSALKVAPFGKRRNAAPSLVHQTRNPRSDSAAALRRTCAARATTPADGATARLLPSYLTQLPPRPCHSLASSISTSGRPTTCDDRRRRRRRPSPPTSQPASQPHTAVATVTPARSLEVLSSAGISQDITTYPINPYRHPIPSITLCILDSTTTTNSHPANRAISSLITNPLHRILRRAYIYIYSPTNSAHWRL